MAGKNKGGREARKPKAEKPKGNASQPSAKGANELIPSAKSTTKRPGGR